MSDVDPIDATIVSLAQLQELADKAANYERMQAMLRRYVAEHAGKYSPPGCNCAWCTEAQDFLDD